MSSFYHRGDQGPISNHICRLLERIPPGTAVREIMMNGEDVSSVEEFVKYDKKTGLVYFTNKSNSTFVGVGERIDMIEFEFAAEGWEDGDYYWENQGE